MNAEQSKKRKTTHVQANERDASASSTAGLILARLVVVLDAGGTIGMSPNDAGKLVTGLSSRGNAIEGWLNDNDISTKVGVRLEVAVCSALDSDSTIDSSLVSVEWLLKLMRTISNCLQRPSVVGVVVTHGTDTLAYSAALSSFCFASRVPIVFTAAQFSLITQPFGDAPGNLVGAIRAASGISHLSGTAVYMNYKLLNAARVVKTSACDVDSFNTLGCPPLGVWRNGSIVYDEVQIDQLARYTDWRVRDMKGELQDSGTADDESSFRDDDDGTESSVVHDNVTEPSVGDLVSVFKGNDNSTATAIVHDDSEPRVFHPQFDSKKTPIIRVLYIYPGITIEDCNHVVRDSPDAVVIVAYGAGNGPKCVRAMVDETKDVEFVVCTQCHTGSVADLYEASIVGPSVTLCWDMTLAATFSKALFAILAVQELQNNEERHKKFRWLMWNVMANEFTPSATRDPPFQLHQ